MLALHVQRPPGRGQHRQPGAAASSRGHDLGRPVQLLEVVQHQQRPALGQVAGHRLGGLAVAAHVQAVGQGLPHHLGVADGCQREEVHAMRECRVQRRRRGQGQPGLADAAGAGQRHQPHLRLGERGAQVLQVAVPPDQRRHRHRQARLGPRLFSGGKSSRRPGPGQLVDVLRLPDVLQPVKPQVPDGHPGRQPGCRQQPRRLGQHHLTAVRGRRDPRRPVHVHADVAVLVPGRLARVQAHPDPHGMPRPASHARPGPAAPPGSSSPHRPRTRTRRRSCRPRFPSRGRGTPRSRRASEPAEPTAPRRTVRRPGGAAGPSSPRCR